MTAARAGSVGAVKALIARGANVNAEEPSHGQTALMWAVSQQHADVGACSSRIGADVRARSVARHRDRAHRQPLRRPNSIKGASVTSISAGSRRCCSRRGRRSRSAKLLSRRSPTTTTAANGASALVVAAHSGHGRRALLLEQGADPNAAGAGYTAAACRRAARRPRAGDALLAKGADPERRAHEGHAEPLLQQGLRVQRDAHRRDAVAGSRHATARPRS